MATSMTDSAEKEKEFSEMLLRLEKAKSWEWDDFMAWLSDVAKSLTKNPKHLRTLAKRLHQCLNPTFPELIHIEALKVYYVALPLVANDPSLLPLFVSPLYAFFTYAKEDSQAFLIDLFNERVFGRRGLVSASMDSLLVCLPMGLDYSGLSEQITNHLRTLRRGSALEFDASLWRAVLKAPAIRVPALELFLLLCQEGDRRADLLAINALTTALREEENEDVLKLIMIAIRHLYPIHTPRISVLHQRQLLSGMLHQLSKRREEISKSIVEYLLPGLADKDKMQNLVVPVLVEVFCLMKTSEESCSECLGLLESLLETKGLRDIRTCVVQGFIFHFLTYIHALFEYTAYGKRVSMKAGLLLNSLEDISALVWESIVHLFLEGFIAADYQGLPVFLFALESYQVARLAGAEMITAAVEIVHRMTSLSGEDYRLSLSILTAISKFCSEQSIALPSSVLPLCDSIISLIFQHKPTHAYIAMQWLCYLHESNPAYEYEKSITVLVACVSSKKVSDQELLGKLFEKESGGLEGVISKRLGSALDFAVFRQLWLMTPKPAGKLLLAMACGRPDRFSDFLTGELNKEDATMEVHRFAAFWHIAVCDRELSLPILFESRPGLIRVLGLLNSPNYHTRQESTYWLVASLSHIDVLINTLVTLLKSSDHCAEGLKYCNNVLRTDGEVVVSTLAEKNGDDLKLAKRFMNSILDLVENGERFGPGSAVPVSACECLYQLLSHKNLSLAIYCFTRVFKLLEQCCHQHHDLVLMELIKIVRLLTLKTDWDDHPMDLRSKIASLEFEKVYLQRIPRNDELLWSCWVDFQVNTFPVVLALVRPTLLIKFAQDLMGYYLMAIHETEEAFDALSVIIYSSLQLLDTKKFIDQHGGLIKTTYTNLESNKIEREVFERCAVRSIALGRIESKTGYLFGDFIVNVMLGVGGVMGTVAKGLKDEGKSLDITDKGVKEFEGQKRGQVVDSHFSSNVKRLLCPFSSSHPGLFFSLCTTMWFTNFQNLTAEGELLYQQIIDMLLLVEFTSLDAVTAANFYLEMGLEVRKKMKEEEHFREKIAGVCHLLYSFLSLTPDAHFISESSQFAFCTSLSSFLSLLSLCPTPESSLWQLHFLHLTCSRLPASTLPPDLQESLRKHYVRLFQQQILLVCSSDETELAYPHPPAVYIKRMEVVSARFGSFFTLIFTLKKTVELFKGDKAKMEELFESEGKELLSKFLNSNDPSAELAANLCLELVTEVGSDLHLTPLLMDFFISGRIWDLLQQEGPQQTMSKWTNFVRIVTEFGYREASVDLVNVVMDVSVGYLTSKANEIRTRDNTLKLLSFLIYCSEISFESALGVIVEKLIEHLRLHEGAYIPVCFLLLRVLMCKIDEATFSETWTRLWPHILVELMRIFKNENIALLHKWAALKLIEFLFVIGHEDFHRHLWVFTYNCEDLRNVQRYQLEPVIVRVFRLISDAAGKRVRLRVATGQHEYVSTHIGSLYQVPDTEEALALSAKDLVTQVIRGLPVLPEIDVQTLRQAIEQDIRML